MSFSPRYLVAANLVLLALAAYSASAIVGTALAAKLVPPLEVDISPPPPPIPQEPAKPEAYYEIIHKRDIFNSAKPPPPAPAAAQPPPTTPLKLKLWGVALHQHNKSYCIIEDEPKRKQDLYHVGDEVPGGAKVKAIEWHRVVLTRNGQDEVLEINSAQVPGPVAAAPRPGGIPVTRPAVADEHIQMTGENEFLIDRSEVDNALENMSQLFTQIRAVPHFEGGRSTGFRLFAIRTGSLFDKIGLKNGDIIQRVNGSDMNDPSKALELLQALRNEQHLTVDVIRNRQPQTLSYQFR